MPDSSAHPLDDPAVDPLDVAREAAADIARISGVERHDIALTLGSGWGRAAELIGETTATIPATDVTGFSKPALEGHVGTLRSILTPRASASSSSAPAPTTTRGTAFAGSCTACAPPPPPARRSWC